MSEDDDTELVRRCVRGDRRAFERLVLKYQKPVYNAALRMLHHPEDARDVAQTVFLKAYEHLADFDPTHRFYSWIYRIALNESINQLNGRKRVVPVPEDEPADGPGPEQVLDAELSGRRIQVALMTLTGEYRAVIVLRHFLDCSYEEMAEVLQLPEKTVKSRLYSARQLLKDALQQTGMPPP
jgi:RNA polymerase sigma-70 factor (ECF subfamily)